MSVISVSVLVGVAGTLAAVFRALSEYSLKARAQRAELDINLARLFAELVPIANGRQGTVVSEAAITAALSIPEVVDRVLGADNERERDLISEFAVVYLPVGIAMQAAAVRSLGYLGEEYEQLREPARAALNALRYFADDEDLKPVRAEALAAIARAKK
jgi:hypothetical protein